MFQRIKNIIRSWSAEDEHNNHEQFIIDEMKHGLEQSQKAIITLKDQLLQHEQNIVALEKEVQHHEKEAKASMKSNAKAQAEVSVAKMYRTEERLNHLRTIYTELSTSLGDLEKNKQRLELKINQYTNKKLLIKAKTISANNELEVIKNISELEEMNDLQALEDQLLEAQCLNEAFDNINNHESSTTATSPDLHSLENKIQLEEKAKQEAELERIAKMMGESPKKETYNAKAKALAIQKEFESSMKTVNDSKKSDLMNKWLKQNQEKEERHADQISDFFSKSSKDDIIDTFFN